jgi:hypothetical protein
MLQIAFSFSFLFLPLMGSEFEKKKNSFYLLSFAFHTKGSKQKEADEERRNNITVK